jgi:hypothetical protein
MLEEGVDVVLGMGLIVHELGLALVVEKEEDPHVAQQRELHGLLQQSLLSLAVSYLKQAI